MAIKIREIAKTTKVYAPIVLDVTSIGGNSLHTEMPAT
jgi:hypothetical protein